MATRTTTTMAMAKNTFRGRHRFGDSFGWHTPISVSLSFFCCCWCCFFHHHHQRETNGRANLFGAPSPKMCQQLCVLLLASQHQHHHTFVCSFFAFFCFFAANKQQHTHTHTAQQSKQQISLSSSSSPTLIIIDDHKRMRHHRFFQTLPTRDCVWQFWAKQKTLGLCVCVCVEDDEKSVQQLNRTDTHTQRERNYSNETDSFRCFLSLSSQSISNRCHLICEHPPFR